MCGSIRNLKYRAPKQAKPKVPVALVCIQSFLRVGNPLVFIPQYRAVTIAGLTDLNVLLARDANTVRVRIHRYFPSQRRPLRVSLKVSFNGLLCMLISVIKDASIPPSSARRL